MRVLIGGSSSKIFHLKEFGESLKKLGIEYRLVHDVEIQDGFPSRKIKNWIPSKKKFNKLIIEFKPDVIFVDRQAHFGLAAIKAKIPLIVHLRGDYWSEIVWAKQTLYKDPIKKTVLFFKDKNANKCFKDSLTIVPICNYLKKIVKEKYPKKPVETLYQGIDPSRWYPTEGMKLKHPCVGLLQGAVIWGKAREMLVLEKVLQSMPNVMFYWAGDGPYRDKILSILKKYKNFEWLGPLEYPNKVREYLTEIDVYALVSGIDMSPLSLQEAQLMKKPVVATNVGGIPELMDNEKTGFLVKKGNAEEWIEKLSLLVKDERKRKRMGNAGKKFVEENFSWDKIVKEFVEILKKQNIT
jgi:glycosyltransferase involved in cell wall biosynthesis